ATLRTLNTAEVTLLVTNQGNYGTIQQMIDAGLLPKFFTGTVNGFNYGVVSVGSEFVSAAIPSSPEAGRYGFYIIPYGVVRYSSIESLSRAGQAGTPVGIDER